MRVSLLCFLGLLCAAPVQAAEWKIETGSRVEFKASFQGEEFTGYFKRFGGTIRFDEAQPEQGKFDIEFDLTSVDSGDLERDRILSEKGWFDFESFPKAQFKTRKFRPLEENTTEADAGLTIRGMTKPVVFAFQWLSKPGGGAHLQGEATLDRLEWGLGADDDWSDDAFISHKVRVTVALDLTQQ